MGEKKNPLYRMIALGIASFSLAGEKGKKILEALENEVKEKGIEEKIEKKFSSLLENLKKAKKEKIADVFGMATKKEIEELKKEIENLKNEQQ